MTTELEILAAKRNELETFEALWNTFIAKLNRLDELKQTGRYGFQLRMPRKSLKIAKDKLDEFCKAHGIVCPV